VDKVGDESTKFFYTTTTERFRINTIPIIDTEDAKTVTIHSEKATVLWDEYKNWLGSTVQPQMHFNLQDLITEHDLQHLNAPFTKEDIDLIIKNLSLVPGPDGFNGTFLKKMLAHYKRRHL
jgi:hypothetical protein